MKQTLERTFVIEGETIEIWRFGIDDYAVNYINGDCSVRGTLLDILQDIEDNYELKSLLMN